jgi:HNH endonuclease
VNTQHLKEARTCIKTNTRLAENNPKFRIIKRVTAVFIKNGLPLWWAHSPHSTLDGSRLSRRGLLERDGFKCAYCDLDLRGSLPHFTLDHVIPKCVFERKAEANHDENLVACCLKCNRLKNDWFPRNQADGAWLNRHSFVCAARARINRLRSRVFQGKKWCSLSGQKNPQPSDS